MKSRTRCIIRKMELTCVLIMVDTKRSTSRSSWIANNLACAAAAPRAVAVVALIRSGKASAAEAATCGPTTAEMRKKRGRRSGLTGAAGDGVEFEFEAMIVGGKEWF
ncbi:hypothetical protein Ccrd_015495 [Cynara cardunculus var. scolymus]|uniref:Uncharacterized protein n=1 Tax=Cynara cardunculus var. scolymus TaxID=59895 RepID=A0A103YBN9_CYNCS|nr:hypothetical protein Ccrd_015495 [Cynara cardunculus var. scolymus]